MLDEKHAVTGRTVGEPIRFADRFDAGRHLAELLAQKGYADREDVIVLALPRGGVPVAYEVARRLHAPLDIFLVRKLGVPGQEELAMGAIATGDVVVVNPTILRVADVPREELERVIAQEREELHRREAAYRGSRPPPGVQGKAVILIDDGLATGASMRAAAEAVRHQNPARIVVAVPVAAAQSCDEFREVVDDVICGETPEPFTAVGIWYEDFSQTTDEEVRELLARANREAHPARV
jgi:predicted phosphoribosyltransferase